MKKLISMILVLSLVFALAACGGKDTTSTPSTSNPTTSTPAVEDKVEEIKSADLQAFYESTFLGENMPFLEVLSGEPLDAFYAGLSALELKQCIVAIPPITAVPFEVAMVEVADAADLAKVEDIFKNRVETQTTPPNYPPVIEAWEKHCKVVTNGNTIMMITMEGSESIVEAFNALFA